MFCNKKAEPNQRSGFVAKILQTVRKRGFAVSPALSIGTGALIAHSERAIRFEKDLSRDVMSQTSRI
jgi:acetolactate synthase regulatory subunit